MHSDDDYSSSLYGHSPSIAASERVTEWEEQASASGDRAEGPKGLSNGHIRPRYEKVTSSSLNDPVSPPRYQIIYYPQGQLVQMKLTGGRGTGTPSESTRGLVKMFSPKSRRRLMTVLATLNRDQLPLFVTLTYPADFPSTDRSKRDLKAFIQRLKRAWPELGYIWKLEFQKRGAPHFHLFIWGVDYKEALQRFSRIWFEVCATGETNHLLAGTSVQPIRNPNGVMKYASKYLGKVIDEESPEGLGRVWGRGGNIPESEAIEYALSSADSAKMLRFLRRRIATENKGIRSFYVPYPDFWLKRHVDLIGDKDPTE